MRDVYIPEPPPRDPWPNRGQLIVMLIGWLLAGGVLGLAVAVLRGG